MWSTEYHHLQISLQLAVFAGRTVYHDESIVEPYLAVADRNGEVRLVHFDLPVPGPLTGPV